jgi:hypothetical protein
MISEKNFKQVIMKTTKQILMAFCFIGLTAFTGKTESNLNQEGSYYFAYVYLGDESHLYISSVLQHTDSNCNIDQYVLSNQFKDYMEAEYNGKVSNFLSHIKKTKADAVKWRRLEMKKAKKITKITDFEYLCDD